MEGLAGLLSIGPPIFERVESHRFKRSCKDLPEIKNFDFDQVTRNSKVLSKELTIKIV